MKLDLLSAATTSLVLAVATLTACATRTNYVDLYGMPAPASAAECTTVISPDIKHVNVEGGQIIKFVAGNKEFAWHFFVAKTVNAFDLNEVAPPGTLDHVVRAYVSPDPRYLGGDGPDM